MFSSLVKCAAHIKKKVLWKFLLISSKNISQEESDWSLSHEHKAFVEVSGKEVKLKFRLKLHRLPKRAAVLLSKNVQT